LTLYWTSLRATPTDYQVFVHLVDASGAKLDQRDVQPLNGARPTHLWEPGDVVPDPYEFSLPATLAPGKFRFAIGLYQPSAGDRVPIIASDGEPVADHLLIGTFTIPDPTLDLRAIHHRREALVGDLPIIKLLGYDLIPDLLAPGETLNLVLYWQALRPMDLDYTIFIHLLDEQGQLLAQQDGPPVQGRAPTSLWYPGETIKDSHSLTLDLSTPVGKYTLSIGWYHWSTGERLSWSEAGGQRLPEDALDLSAQVVVTESRP
jgi:hypothetical protein